MFVCEHWIQLMQRANQIAKETNNKQRDDSNENKTTKLIEICEKELLADDFDGPKNVVLFLVRYSFEFYFIQFLLYCWIFIFWSTFWAHLQRSNIKSNISFDCYHLRPKAPTFTFYFMDPQYATHIFWCFISCSNRCFSHSLHSNLSWRWNLKFNIRIFFLF